MAEPPDLFELDGRRPLLVARLRGPHRVLSWAPARPGFQRADRVAWLEVGDADLPVGRDPAALLAARLHAEGLGDAVAMMTSRDVRSMCRAAAAVDGVAADCAATVGLANAARIGCAAPPGRGMGTINLLAVPSVPLAEAALIEAVSIAAEARTAAVLDAGIRVGQGLATGTGTDCIVVAAPEGADGLAYCGLHTAAGQALGAAVYAAVRRGAEAWRAERGR